MRRRLVVVLAFSFVLSLFAETVKPGDRVIYRGKGATEVEYTVDAVRPEGIVIKDEQGHLTQVTREQITPTVPSLGELKVNGKVIIVNGDALDTGLSYVRTIGADGSIVTTNQIGRRIVVNKGKYLTTVPKIPGLSEQDKIIYRDSFSGLPYSDRVDAISPDGTIAFQNRYGQPVVKSPKEYTRTVPTAHGLREGDPVPASNGNLGGHVDALGADGSVVVVNEYGQTFDLPRGISVAQIIKGRSGDKGIPRENRATEQGHPAQVSREQMTPTVPSLGGPRVNDKVILVNGDTFDNGLSYVRTIGKDGSIVTTNQVGRRIVVPKGRYLTTVPKIPGLSERDKIIYRNSFSGIPETDRVDAISPDGTIAFQNRYGQPMVMSPKEYTRTVPTAHGLREGDSVSASNGNLGGHVEALGVDGSVVVVNEYGQTFDLPQGAKPQSEVCRLAVSELGSAKTKSE